MRAYVLDNINDFKLKTVPEPVPAENEVIVAVKAAGICGSDIARVYGGGAYSYPLIPGHEFSGVVTALGSKADKRWLNKRVGIFPLIPCRKCVACQKKQYELCRNYSYLGSRRNGGFAEYAAVPEENLIELPEDVSFEEAAMLEPMAVAVHAIRRIKPGKQERVTVCGLGTIGLLLLMYLKEAGVERILVIGNKESQKKNILRLGIAEADYADCRKLDISKWLMERTDGVGTDVFFECVGRNETFVQAVDNMAPAGKIMLVGNPHSDMNLKKQVYWKILRNQLTVLGTWNSSFTNETQDDWHYVLERLRTKKIAPQKLISHRLSLEDLSHGFHIMRNKTEDYIKIMGIM